jgi:transcriptional regulator with XRE-family HTH domain
VTSTFDSWLNGEMAARGIRSARRLALEAGLDAEHVADWVLGQNVPSDEECAKLASYLGVPAADVAERRFPSRRSASNS